MKKSILTMAALAFILGTMFSGCNTSKQKLEDAEEDLVEANEALDQANADYLADLEQFRKDVEAKTISNDQMIAEFKSRIAKQKASVRAEWEKKITAMEESNARMKSRMAEYKDEGIDKWEAFKLEFNRDMDELGKALSDFTINSDK